MVKALKGSLLTCDAAVKQIILQLDERDKFIIADLDETHLLVATERVEDIKAMLDVEATRKTYVYARWLMHHFASSPPNSSTALDLKGSHGIRHAVSRPVQLHQTFSQLDRGTSKEKTLAEIATCRLNGSFRRTKGLGLRFRQTYTLHACHALPSHLV
ncbi:uncharacterized protein L969DRAFT_96767 [Mixia osmundae IAM 14324]|uniref:General transcription and DNA repair factor IIH subunit TFB5 n=1 Tax=Mixia osmundae (strain CBS 9802 / IAM 14324 / JCM 22182 / KY 12970) TaxID=764103 RepID=G7DZN5_MIXOS|nr:uncharacterized protein L969DRAFT_96767 [Mixia osmundae IAM 14324]KEI37207.1 hypothetical protein L969DRAFT_96767 [Mixia osmundae IAM 14324]GAA96045.1 hypothetical protein E5Q_02706 [Mixia osmundae IAM 14324]